MDFSDYSSTPAGSSSSRSEGLYSSHITEWRKARDAGALAVLAEVLIRQTYAKQGIDAGQLTIHADRGSSMTSKPVAFLLADLAVAQSHSRPHVSNDNRSARPSSRR
jgi:putative transposase